jgi:hypothetical protein
MSSAAADLNLTVALAWLSVMSGFIWITTMVPCALLIEATLSVSKGLPGYLA